jgi:hypothetical protein
MALASDIINAGMRRLRIIDIDSTADATQLANGLLALNAMIDEWNAEKITLYEEKELTALTLTGATSYTIGSGGALNVTRPERILSAYFRVNSIDYPVLKIVQKQEWDVLPTKTEVGQPYLLWYDMAYPLGVLHLWPNPASGELFLTVALQLTEFASATTTVSLPAGYRKALIDNFAVYYSAEGGILTDQMREDARMSLAAVKRRNSQRTNEVQLEVSGMIRSRYGNILRGP